MSAEGRLRELLGYLNHHRQELREAESKGDADFVDRCQIAILQDAIAIHRHCEENGLDVPPDVPDPK